MGSLLSQPEPEPSHPPGLHGHRQRRNDPCDFEFKVTVVGAFGSGKTSLVLRSVADRFQETPMRSHQPVGQRTIEFKGLNISISIWDSFQSTDEALRIAGALAISSKYFLRSDAILICFDADRPESLSTFEPWLSQVRKDSLPLDLVSFVGCKVDLNPSLFYSAWDEARNIVVAIKPDRDVGCAFAVLPDELIFAIALLLAKMDGERGLQPPLDDGQHRDKKQISRRDLGELSARYQRPVYLTSAKERIGIDELLLSLAEDIFETFWLAKDGVPIAETDRKGELRNTGDDGKDYRLQPYCIGRRHMKKANSNDNCSI